MARGWITVRLEQLGEHIARYGWCDASGMVIAPDPAMLAPAPVAPVHDADDEGPGGIAPTGDGAPDRGPQLQLV